MSSRSLNKVLLIGNLTRDPELRYTPSGTAVCSFSLATNREWVDGSGQKQESTDFERIVAWGKLAEICSQLLFKGRKVFVAGRLQTRSWQGQDGAERQTTEVVIDEMIALGEGRGGVPQDDGGYAPEPSQVGSNQAMVEAEEVFGGEAGATVPKSSPTKSRVTRTKSKAEEVADDIPF